MFTITDARGFQLTFSNGWTISVQFGGGNYCENRDTPFDAARKTSHYTCPDAEIAIWYKGSEMIELVGDSVAGWVSTDTVAKIIGEMVTWPSISAPHVMSEARINKVRRLIKKM